jgi:hypothetical protein
MQNYVACLFWLSNRDLTTRTATKFHPRLEQLTPSAAQFPSSRNLGGWKRRLVVGAKVLAPELKKNPEGARDSRLPR